MNNKLAVILGFSLLIGGAAIADEANFEQRIKEKCKGDAACEAKHKEWHDKRVERREKFLDKKCKGDKKCEEEMKQKFEAKREEKKAELDQKCGQDEACRKAEREKMKEEFKAKHKEMREKHLERKQNSTGGPAPEPATTPNTTP